MFLCGNNRQFIIGNNDDCVFTTNVGQKTITKLTPIAKNYIEERPISCCI